MKTKFLSLFLFLGLSVALISCDQENIAPDDSALVDFAALATNAASVSVTSTAEISTQRPKCVGKKSRLTEVNTSGLPVALTSYLTDKHAGASIVRAGQTSEGGFIILITKAEGTKAALLFDMDGGFVSEGHHRSRGTMITAANLPAAINTYIAANFSDASFKKARQEISGNYVVVLKKADGTIVGLAFDADGSFISELAMDRKFGHAMKEGKDKGSKGKGPKCHQNV